MIINKTANLIELSQNSEAWHDWRENGVGASEASVIMGENPYKTPLALWQEKVGMVEPPDLSANPFIERGNRYEPVALERVAEKLREHGVISGDLSPACLEMVEHPEIRASLDGFDLEGRQVAVEIKVPSERRFQDAAQVHAQIVEDENPRDGAYPASRADLDEAGMAQYWAQLQQQMLVAGLPWIVFYVYSPELQTGIAFRVEADPHYQDGLREAVLAFWRRVVDLDQPDPDPARDRLDIQDIEDAQDRDRWTRAEEYWLELDREQKELEARIKTLKGEKAIAQKTFEEVMGDRSSAKGVAGITVSRYAKKGTIQWEAFLTDKAPGLDRSGAEEYRKSASFITQVRAPKR